MVFSRNSRGFSRLAATALLCACFVAPAGATVLEGARDARDVPLILTDETGRARLQVVLVPEAAAPGVTSIARAALEGRPTKALSGYELVFMGEPITLADLTCPSPETENGRAAKALLNTFLRRAGYFRCDLGPLGNGWQGTCFVADRQGFPETNIAAGMRQSGFCE